MQLKTQLKTHTVILNISTKTFCSSLDDPLYPSIVGLYSAENNSLTPLLGIFSCHVYLDS